MSGYDNTSETFRKTAVSTTMTNNDFDILVIGATGPVTVTLLDCTTIQPGRTILVYKDAAAQTITISAATGQTIDGAAGQTTTLATGAIHSKKFITDGANWFTVDAY